MMRPWMPQKRLALTTKCTMCRSFTCERESAYAAHAAADAAFTSAVVNKTDRTGLYPALKTARAFYDKAWDLCNAARCEHNRQMDIFIAALKVYVCKSTYALGCAVSEGVRQSMLPGRFGATMLCMRGAR